MLIILLVLAHVAFGASDPKWQPRFSFADSPERQVELMARMTEVRVRVPLTEAEVWANLTAFEGYKLVPYPDGPRGAFSVGVGHNLTAHHERVKARYTDAEVRAFFRRDLAAALDACRAGIRDFDELPRQVQLVAINLVWTCGPMGFNGLRGFKALRTALSYRHFNAAAAELADSKWYREDVGAARANWAYQVLLRPNVL